MQFKLFLMRPVKHILYVNLVSFTFIRLNKYYRGSNLLKVDGPKINIWAKFYT